MVSQQAVGLPLNIAAATGLELTLKWPGGQEQVVPAQFASNGTDGNIGAALPGGLGGGWGLYWVGARAIFPNQVLRAGGGRLWFGWICQCITNRHASMTIWPPCDPPPFAGRLFVIMPHGLAATAAPFYPPCVPGACPARPPTTKHGGLLKKIPLTQGQVALVDDEDFDRFGHLKWYAAWCESTQSFYVQREEDRKTIRLHRAIMGVTDPRVRVDHRNHDTLDCRRQTNLRICTQAQNLANRSGLDANNTSGHRGVSWHKRIKKWAAHIRANGKLIHLGYFSDKAIAARVYAAANRQHFGEFGGNTK